MDLGEETRNQEWRLLLYLRRLTFSTCERKV